MNNILNFFITILLSFVFVASAWALERDDFVESTLSNYEYKGLKTSVPFYNHEDTTKIKIVLSPVEKIKSGQARDGDVVEFIVRENVVLGENLVLLEGMKIKGCVETVVTQGMNGIPAMIFLNDFEIPGVPQEKIKSVYIKKGLNLSYLVFPLKWALTIFPPSGSLTNFIIGGPASISTRNKIKLYYYPNWESADIIDSKKNIE